MVRAINLLWHKHLSQPIIDFYSIIDHLMRQHYEMLYILLMVLVLFVMFRNHSRCFLIPVFKIKQKSTEM